MLNKGWVERLKEENGRHPDFENQPKVGLDNLSFVAYSSGTTGEPKGILCPQRGAALSNFWRNAKYPYQPDDRVACNVFFVWEMFRPLLKGIPIYIIPNDIIYDPPLLMDFLHANKITRILITPSILEIWLETQISNLPEKLCAMRVIWLNGEVVTTTLRDRTVAVLPHVKLLSLYGASEFYNVTIANLSVPDLEVGRKGITARYCQVGKLFPGVHCVIMDDDLDLLPVGESGEIYIGGHTLARGYINRPETTAKRFIKRPGNVPASVGEILFRTGDWGYVMTDGTLMVCGRCDSLVKIRGYSVGLQMVEAALLDLPLVNAAVVLAEGEEGADKRLIAYVVPEGDVTGKEIRNSLKKHLIYYMVPSFVVLLPSIPLVTATGKLDKRALHKFKLDAFNRIEEVGNNVVPTTPTEKTVSLLWTGVLHIKNIDIQEDFFSLGGNEILAAKLLENMKKEFGQNFTIADLHLHDSIESMARMIDTRRN